MIEIQLLGYKIPGWIVFPVVYFSWVTILIFVKKICFAAIKRFSENTKTKLDDIFIRSADFPLTLLIFTSGGIVLERLLAISTDTTSLTAHFLLVFKAITITAIILFMDRFSNGLLEGYSQRVEILRSTGGIVRGLIRLIVIGLGLLVLLDTFGVSITPILASLGIGSLAVALALQPTLENFFAGIQLIIDKPIQEGQFVKLESGEEGCVERIGWRSTWIRMLPNNMIILPNKLLVDAKILNFHYPQKELVVAVEVGVHYDSDLEHVEKVIVDVARQTLKNVEGGVRNFDPVVRFHTFADFSINGSVILRAEEYTFIGSIKHEFIKRLHRRFAEEKIVIPYPIEAVNYDQEKAWKHLKDIKD